MKYKTLSVESTVIAGVTLITLRRPEALHALNTTLCAELRKVFEDLNKKTLGEVRCIILTGEGEKAFCAGADLKQRKGLSSQAWLKQHSALEKAAKAIASSKIPLIAAVNGIAFGGGCELAMMADLIIASDRARFAQPETRLGIIPGMGGTQRLQRVIGSLRAKEMVLCGRVIDAPEALAWGLVNQVVPHTSLISTALQWAEMIARMAPLATREARRVMNEGADIPIAKALRLEIQAYKKVVESSDRKEGLTAFFEKRSPRY
ncbi:enoyl-CoA hydratase/isomerase family protein [bacterium]|nr:enoyl-CoA hydratase/isomerase family protein [bacterium]